MINQGLLEEDKALFEYRDLNALQTVGYRELFAYLDHQIDFETAVALIKTNTRRFSKRQMTWFQKDATTLWFDYHTKPEDVIKAIRRS
jgi:tRNA dimethylallyltransferase